METNHSHPENPNSLPPIREETQPQVRQRAPTLMMSAAGGSPDSVRIWRPNGKELWRLPRVYAWQTLFFSILSVILFFAGWDRYGSGVGNCIVSLFALCFFSVLSVIGMCRPSYITTDDHGIGLTLWKGSRSLRWEEIDSISFMKSRHHRRLIIRLYSLQPIVVSLLGYPTQQRTELVELICVKANLQLYSKLKGIYRRSSLISRPSAPPALHPGTPPSSI